MEEKADSITDQEAINALIDDCYPDGWPWRIDDFAYDLHGPKNQNPWHVSLVYKEEGNTRLDLSRWSNPQLAKNYRPYAGIWVEGRLREEMGEAFLRMEYFDREETPWWEIHYYVDDYIDPLRIGRAPTVITTLVAALREVLKQKEGE